TLRRIIRVGRRIQSQTAASAHDVAAEPGWLGSDQHRDQFRRMQRGPKVSEVGSATDTADNISWPKSGRRGIAPDGNSSNRLPRSKWQEGTRLDSRSRCRLPLIAEGGT